MKPSSRLDALRDAESIAQGLKKFLQLDYFVQPPNTIDFLIPPLDLTSSLDSSMLETSRFPEPVVQQLLLKIQHAVQSLKDEHQAKYQENCRALMGIHRPDDIQSMLERLRHVYKNSYERHFLPSLRKSIMSSLNTSVTLRTETERKTPFNNEYTPLLEKYFESNAYPSATDRQLLARDSTMTVRQIDVWFQNHRRRARNDGKFLRRYPEDLRSVDPDTASTDDYSDNCSDAELMEPVIPPKQSCITLDPIGPSHAYPAPYRRTPRSNIFSLKYDGEDYEFHPQAPEWRRYPASTLPSTSSIDFSEFTNLFQTALRLRSQIEKDRPSKNLPARECWFAHRHTIPSPAPHPAFKPLVCATSTPYVATWIKDHASHSTAASGKTAPKKKVSCRRKPKSDYTALSKSTSIYNFPNRKRNSRTSISLSSTPRTSSLCSSYSSGACTRSSSSSSSSLPSTPPTSPQPPSLALPPTANQTEALPEFALQDQIFQALYGSSMPALFPDHTNHSLKKQHSSLPSKSLPPVVCFYS